jgi:integrase
VESGDDAETVAPETAKVLGPYRNGDKWRLLVFDPHRQAKVFDDYETAVRVRDRLLVEIDGRASQTIRDAVADFLAHKRKRGCTERSIRTVRDKLAWLPLDNTLTSITPQKAERLYLEHTEQVAVATHHASLRFTKALFKWCIKQKHLLRNPFVDVQPIGKANRGKLLLRLDEAKRLSDFLVVQATQGDYRALALLVQVLLGLRSGEVLNLRKRDLDCGGRRVVIEGTKNDNAKRTVELKDAPMAMELLARRVATLAPDALIFAPADQACRASTTVLHKALRRFCKLACVPVVCPHSLRGLNATLAVEAGATCALVARALGHGSDAVTRRHYIAPSALDSARSARVESALLGTADLDGLITTLRNLPAEQLDTVCSAVGYRR